MHPVQLGAMLLNALANAAAAGLYAGAKGLQVGLACVAKPGGLGKGGAGNEVVASAAMRSGVMAKLLMAWSHHAIGL